MKQTWKKIGSAFLHIGKKLAFLLNNALCMLVFAGFGAAAMGCLAVTMGIQGLNIAINEKLGEKCTLDDWMTVIENWWDKK